MANIIKIKRGLKANLASLELLPGEFGVALDTQEVYVGDDQGVVRPIKASASGSVDQADKLSVPRKIEATQDATGYAMFDGSADVQIALTLANSGVSAGTYTKLTVNQKGLVTAGGTLSKSDLPTIDITDITGISIGADPGDVPIIGVDGKLNPNIIPQQAITDVFVVNSESEMLALDAHAGDVAIRLDNNTTYILQANPATTLSNWIVLPHPDAPVLSVNGKTGVVVIGISDIANLQSSLNSKQATLVGTQTAGQNLKTVNGQTLLGTGDLQINSGVWGNITGEITDQDDLMELLDGKMDDVTLTANRAIVSNSSGALAVSAVTSTQLGYVAGVTSSIQGQLNNKLGINDVIDGGTF